MSASAYFLQTTNKTPSGSSRTDQDGSALLDLPPELRLCIYEQICSELCVRANITVEEYKLLELKGKEA